MNSSLCFAFLGLAWLGKLLPIELSLSQLKTFHTYSSDSLSHSTRGGWVTVWVEFNLGLDHDSGIEQSEINPVPEDTLSTETRRSVKWMWYHSYERGDKGGNE